jgi:hypothetical protein
MLPFDAISVTRKFERDWPTQKGKKIDMSIEFLRAPSDVVKVEDERHQGDKMDGSREQMVTLLNGEAESGFSLIPSEDGNSKLQSDCIVHKRITQSYHFHSLQAKKLPREVLISGG